ncbi:non-hydrolyzing UDP-N-acetylglucosamine 2-epimerase [Thalassospira lucentensis]|uniref:non-hydrolyzing UDP-N-acetylglucosamine 2-epimerase n=1 Tax=Thalassospira lucentensis TaxID=168935 RepID=UPI003D2F4309
MKLHLIAGARPNFMKIAPLWHGLRGHHKIKSSFVHTAQHRDDEMSSAIWRELGLPDPDHVLSWKNPSGQNPVTAMMAAYEGLCNYNRPDAVCVVGDVNSSLAAATIAHEMHIPLIHLEAGLRCFDQTMREESNRVAIDHMADLLLTPSSDADGNLLKEGILPSRIKQVGNIMIDTLVRMADRIEQAQVHEKYGLTKENYCLVTLHRPDNVDVLEPLRRICRELVNISNRWPVCFPVHPRTKKRMEKTGCLEILRAGNVRLLPPLGYAGFARLMRDAALVITDSGGVQEETSYLGVRCLTLRKATERPITITHGTNSLVGIDMVGKTALTFAHDQWDRDDHGGMPTIPFWDGSTASRVIAELDQFMVGGMISR